MRAIRSLWEWWDLLLWSWGDFWTPPKDVGWFQEEPTMWSEKAMDPTPALLPGKSHGRRSLVGHSPWGLEESDTTERLHFHLFHYYVLSVYPCCNRCQNFHLFKGWTLFHHLYVAPIFLSVHLLTLRWLPPLGYCDVTVNMGVQISLRDPFQFFWIHTRK